jgi:tetratricopeptide (TPR) repeat protein
VLADYEAGYQQLKAGEYKAAIKAFKRVIDANPNHAMAYNNMAYSYRKLGKFKHAISLYEKALTLEPDLPEAHEYIGEAFIALGRIDEAKKHLAILEKLDPRLAEELRAELTRQNRS